MKNSSDVDVVIYKYNITMDGYILSRLAAARIPMYFKTSCLTQVYYVGKEFQ